MTKIQLPEWLDLPESTKSVIEGLDIDQYIASVTKKDGKLYHKITVNGDLAKLLGVNGRREILIEHTDKSGRLYHVLILLSNMICFLSSLWYNIS